MAKARTKASVRDRAVAAFRKDYPNSKISVFKSRSKKIITIKTNLDDFEIVTRVWSYEGGNLKRLSSAQAAGKNGLSACISDI